MTPTARNLALFFSSSFCWNVGIGMTHILVPLYAYHLGFSGVAIGTLVSLPVVAQVGLNLLGGAWSDRLGGYRLALWSSAAVVIAGALFANASTFAWLFAAQFALIVARAMFWPATWALGSLIPGDRSRILGTLNSVTGAGQILGTAAAGVAIVQLGFAKSFWLLAGVGGALSFALMLGFRAPDSRPPAGPHSMFATYRRLLERHVMYFALICAYFSALPFSLAFSFYPILLIDEGYSSDATGWFMALRGVGSVAAGFVAGRSLRRIADAKLPFIAGLAVACSVLLVAASRHPLPLSAFLFGAGLGSGILTLYFQMLIADVSSPAERASALALGGLGWGLSHLTTPLVMGVLNDALGIVPAFYVMGVIAVLGACGLVPMHRWAFRQLRPA